MPDYRIDFPRAIQISDALRQLAADDHIGTILRAAADRIDALERLDREAATHVETVICMRTGFTGDPPYVGWRGLGLALNEALDERDTLREKFQQ